MTGALINDAFDCFSHGCDSRGNPVSPVVAACAAPRNTTARRAMMNRLVSVAHHRRRGAVGGGGRARRPPPVPLRSRGQPFVRAQVVQRIARCVFSLYLLPSPSFAFCARVCVCYSLVISAVSPENSRLLSIGASARGK